MKDIGVLAGKIGVRNPQIRKAVFAAGPCPGLWRVYYAATLGAETHKTVLSREYLGITLPSRHITSRELGLLFERWVREANRVYNAFLETLHIAVLDTIPGMLGRFYRTRAGKLLAVADQQACLKTGLLVDPQVSPYPNILDLTPDGLFANGLRGAIFESKLSQPSYIEFDYEAAAYAIGYEKSEGKDVDSAIVLHSNYPTRQHLSTLVSTIRDSTVGNISTNLERFILLVQYSQQRVDPTGRFASWRSFLVRPRGLPELNQRGPCPSCRFRSKCYGEGGET